MKARYALWLLFLVGALLAPVGLVAAEPEGVDSSEENSTPPVVQPEKISDESEKPAEKRGEASNDDLKSARRLADDEYYELYRSLADTLDQVERNYVKPVDRRELMEAAIRGVLDKLDPYSSYIGPTEMRGFRTSVESQFGGIGIQITIDEGQIKVTSPLVGTPAYRAGIQAGDKIVKIEGEPTDDFTLDQAVRKLKGEIGTSVTLTVQHALTDETETFTLEREQIHIDTVLGHSRKTDDSWDYLLDPEKRIGYLRVTAFSRDTASELRKALEQLQAHKLRGLVLDLRFNPGGLLTSAIEVADLFISKGRIVSTKGRNTQERAWDAVKRGTFEGFPMVVLVNRYSASASEIVAACLQDHNRAIVIGERTWGKGSVQNVIELESGKSALKLTTASYARPNGHNIHRFPDAKESDEWGVKPNDGLEVKLSPREMTRLLEYRRNRDIVPAKRPEQPKAEDSEEATPSSDSSKDDADEGDDETKTDAGKPTNDETSDKAAESERSEKSEKKSTNADEQIDDAKPARADRSEGFVDRQLQKAIEYLTTELARAP